MLSVVTGAAGPVEAGGPLLKAFLPRFRFASGLVGLTKNVCAFNALTSTTELLLAEVEGARDAEVSSSSSIALPGSSGPDGGFGD